jgi:hypothetical protein
VIFVIEESTSRINPFRSRREILLASGLARCFPAWCDAGFAPMSPASGDAAVLIGALTQRGYRLGQNLTYEARGAAGKLSQMPKQMQELKTANVDVVVTVSYPVTC